MSTSGTAPEKQLLTELEFFRKSHPKISLYDGKFAECMDEKDPLRQFRSKFQFPLLGSLPIGNIWYINS